MRARLEEFLEMARLYDQSKKAGPDLWGADEITLDNLRRREPTIKQILRTLDPELADFNRVCCIDDEGIA